MCAWAEKREVHRRGLCEHHGVRGGYLPSPLVLASAIAYAHQPGMMLSLIVILPFTRPVRLAEDIAVLDLISKRQGVLHLRGSGPA